MAKYCNPSALDAALNYIKNATNESICVGQPTTRAQAATAGANMLAAGSITLPSPAAGDAGGNSRKIVPPAVNGLTAAATGTGDHVALYDATVLYYVTTCAGQSIATGNTVNIGSWKVEFADPT